VLCHWFATHSGRCRYRPEQHSTPTRPWRSQKLRPAACMFLKPGSIPHPCPVQALPIQIPRVHEGGTERHQRTSARSRRNVFGHYEPTFTSATSGLWRALGSTQWTVRGSPTTKSRAKSHPRAAVRTSASRRSVTRIGISFCYERMLKGSIAVALNRRVERAPVRESSPRPPTLQAEKEPRESATSGGYSLIGETRQSHEGNGIRYSLNMVSALKRGKLRADRLCVSLL
jgi:hypothetical protein